MTWDEGQTMQARFEHAAQAGGDLHRHWRLGASYGGFTSALTKHFPRLLSAIVRRFQRQMQSMAGGRWKVRNWLAFAADGTRQEAPHTVANETHLGCAGKEKTAPQVYLTSLWHLGLGLPWDFRNGPGTDSERHHLQDMLPGLPSGSLVVTDAGFVGFELCQAILEQGHSFLLRVGGNVTLLTELGYHYQEEDGLVYLWPHDHRDQPPLVLRLIVLTQGKQTIYLLTNVLDAADLSEQDAAVLYEMRWGVEVGYRSYKQTLDRRRLLSRTPTTCLVESGWIMIGLWLLGLLCVRRQLAQGHPPRRWSTAKARDAVRHALRNHDRWPGRDRSRSLDDRLRAARHDDYVRRREKTARNYPRQKRQHPLQPPKVKPATPQQIQLAQQLRKKLNLAA